MKKPKDAPLTCTVTRNGVLRIEIGMSTLAVAALASEYADALPKPCAVNHERGFAIDVENVLMDELGEDGSTILTQALDRAIEAVIENGSEFFDVGDDE